MKNLYDLFESHPYDVMLIYQNNFSIEYEISLFKEYLEESLSSIKHLQDKFKLSIADFKSESPEIMHEFENHCTEQFEKFGLMYPNLLNNSMLITIYSYFETKLKVLYEQIVKIIPGLPKLKRNKSLIESYKSYITGNLHINLDDFNDEWNYIVSYKNIRNLIVHNNSTVEEVNRDMINYINNHEYLELNSSNGSVFIIDNKYLMDFCDLIKIYLDAIYSKAEDKIKAHNSGS